MDSDKIQIAALLMGSIYVRRETDHPRVIAGKALDLADALLHEVGVREATEKKRLADEASLADRLAAEKIADAKKAEAQALKDKALADEVAKLKADQAARQVESDKRQKSEQAKWEKEQAELSAKKVAQNKVNDKSVIDVQERMKKQLDADALDKAQRAQRFANEAKSVEAKAVEAKAK